MAVANVISQRMSHDQLVVRHDIEDFNAKSRLIVDASQEAIFYKNGQALDLFGAGDHPLNSENVPFIKKILGALFGKTPFPCHVYFINKISVLDMRWGTSSPIMVRDPQEDILVGVRSNGQSGVRVVDSRKFVEKIVGTIQEYTTDAIEDAIYGKMQMMIKECIATAITQRGIGILEITGHLSELADIALEKINQRVKSLGIELSDFSINTVTARDEDLEELTRISRESKERRTIIRDTAFKYDTLNTSYQQERQYDVLESAAKNEGAAGGFINMGVGFGVGAGMAKQVGNMTNVMQSAPMDTPPNGGTPTGGAATRKCSSCGNDIPASSKFCPHCGQQQAPQQRFCPECGNPCGGESKFCPNCGTKLV